jgi:hypothetical protein
MCPQMQDRHSKSSSMVMDPRQLSSDSNALLKPSDASNASIFGAQVPQSASSCGLCFGKNAGDQCQPLSVFSSISISLSADGRDDVMMISILVVAMWFPRIAHFQSPHAVRSPVGAAQC